jgi:small redox-active disulfide protein 2
METEETMEIRILGTGCAKCRKLYEETDRALKLLGLTAKMTKVEKIEDIMAFRVLMTPALVIDGQVKAAGRIPTTAELTNWLTTAAMGDDTDKKIKLA